MPTNNRVEHLNGSDYINQSDYINGSKQQWMQRLRKTGYQLITTLLLFGLLFELLRPWYHSAAWDIIFVPQLLAISSMLSLALGVFVKRLFLQWIGHVFIIIGLLYKNFAHEGQSLIDWLVMLPSHYFHAVNEMINIGVFNMDDLIRTTLLLIGWIILIVSVQQLIWQFHVSGSLVIVAISYFIILHTLFAHDVYASLLRVSLYGVILMALTNYAKRQLIFAMPTVPIGTFSSSLTTIKTAINKKRIGFSRNQQASKLLYYGGSIACMLVLLYASSMLLSMNKPKEVAASSWGEAITHRFINDIAAFSTHVSGQPLSRQLASQTKRASGYSLNDEQLGASISFDHKPVFKAWSPHPVYWRGEAKSTYTGQGWGSDDEHFYTLHTTQTEEDALAAWSTKLELKGPIIKQEVEWITPTAHMPLFHGGTQASILDIQAVEPDRDLTNYIEEEWSHNIYPPTTAAKVTSYRMLAELPITDEQVLREVEPIENELAEYVWQRDTLEQYLQLPEQLPVRVSALANEIAGGGLTSRYDQVKAVEQYLKTNYTYNTKSKIPSKGEDFVDHFLFEQQYGYCVHFASAMVVLLRTQNIPARYVKGYSSGEVIDERISDEGFIEKLYEVGSEDAHAWVEVYFPGAGWVTFDPTPSSAEHAEAVGFLGMLHDAFNKLNVEKYFLQATQLIKQYALYIYAAGIALIILIAVVVSLRLLIGSKLYFVGMYRRAYVKTIHYIKHTQENKHMQLSRLTRSDSHHDDAAKLQHQFDKLIVYLERLIDTEILLLEKRIGTKAKPQQTRRQRIEALSENYHQPTIELLLSACVWIETVHYSSYKIEDMVQHLPLPRQISQFSRHIRVDLSLLK